MDINATIFFFSTKFASSSLLEFQMSIIVCDISNFKFLNKLIISLSHSELT